MIRSSYFVPLRLAAVAVLGLAAIAPAHAQIIMGNNATGSTLFTADLNQSYVSSSPRPFLYTYIVRLDSSSPGVNVNTFTFNFAAGVPITYVSSPGYNEAFLPANAFTFGATTGLVTVGDQATFSFSSPMPPVPNGVGVSATSGADAGGGTSALGPAPEPSQFAALGIGLLGLGGLALKARKRREA